jgi:hypothetical protein
MLYNKEKGAPKKRSYEYLHVHATSEQVHRLHQNGRNMINGTPKKSK